VDDGRLNAEHLLADVLGVQRLELYLQYDRPLQPRELEAFKTLLRRRAAREPLQYVLGKTTFRELELSTDSRALIPRPETELLVGEVLSWAQGEASCVHREGTEGPHDSPTPPGTGSSLVAMDLGTGTGAIALSLLQEGPFGHVVATDVSSGALALALENAQTLGLAEGLDLREGPLFEPLSDGERFHVIVSNPPYVPEADCQALAPEIGEWEPLGALIAGNRGLDVLSPLSSQAADFLFQGGLLAMEIGDGQGEEVSGLLEEAGAFRGIRVIPDLAGRDRIVLANRR
jgi:release factor glutamine methyltransferase